MTFKTLGLMIAATLVALPMATAKAGPHTPIASNGEAVSNMESGNSKFSPSSTGTGYAFTGAAAALSADKLEWLEAAVPMTAPVGTELVIGNDTRKLVGNTKKFPFRAVVLIYFGGGYQCTGWMISKDTLATAGHCVYDPGVGFYSTSSYTLIPAYNGGQPYGSCGAKTLYTVNGWANSGKDDYDYGAIKLDCTVGTKTGWFGYFWTKKNKALKGKKVKIAGFPGDKTPTRMWVGKGKTTTIQNRRVFYKIDTYGGQSGSAVFLKKSGCGQCSMAIHAYGTYGSPPYSNNNHGTRITKAVYKNLQSWKK